MSAADDAPDIVTVVITRADGGLTVKRIIEKEYRDGKLVRRVEVTPEFIEAELAKREVFKGHLGWEIVPNDYLNEATDCTYREAWKHMPGSKKPGHDMDKARLLQRIYLRKSRMAEFDRLDSEYRLADEANDQAEKKRIGAIKQKFRDVTADPRIEAAQTIEELKRLTLKEIVPETIGEKYTDKMRFGTAKQAEIATAKKNRKL